MPPFPTQFTSDITATMLGQQTVMKIYQNAALGEQRMDTTNSGVKMETLTFINSTGGKNTTTSYDIVSVNGHVSCSSYSFPTPPPKDDLCGTPTYAGTATVNGQSCQYWTLTCASPQLSNNTFYWSGNAPVRFVSSSSGFSIQIDFSNFVAGPPAQSVFAIPPSCNTQIRKSTRTVSNNVINKVREVLYM